MNKPNREVEAEVEALFNLTIRAYERFIFLRPMLANQGWNRSVLRTIVKS
jgi:hypothetical protein